MEIFNENLLTPLFSSKNTEGEKNDCVAFLNQLEGWKTKCKNLHWSSPKLSIHVKLDEFGNRISGNIARKLGILTRKQNDWKAVEELDILLRKYNTQDPALYDFALFGLGALEKF